LPAGAPQGIDHGDGAPAHGGDVTEVDHHAAVAREPGHLLDKIFHQAFDGKQQVTIAIGDRRAVVAQQDTAGCRTQAITGRAHHGVAQATRQGLAQCGYHIADVALVGKASAGAQGGHQCLQVDGIGHGGVHACALA
jgi:hypothetical protein